VFHVGSSSSPYERLYYCDPTTASTPLSSGLGYSINPTWSPNNSSVMYLGNSSGNYYIYKVTAYTTSTSQIMSNITFNSSNTLGVKWKR
jgi:Tol biopolymer transport system component